MVNSFLRTLAGVLATVAVSSLGATSLDAQVATADARAFLGEWDVAVEGDPPVTFQVSITDEDGQLAAEVTGIEGNKYTVRELRKNEENLVLGYTSSIGGAEIPIVITVAAEGDQLRGNVDLAGVQTSPVRATKRQS